MPVPVFLPDIAESGDDERPKTTNKVFNFPHSSDTKPTGANDFDDPDVQNRRKSFTEYMTTNIRERGMSRRYSALIN